MTEQQTRPVERPRATALTAYEPRDLGELRQFAQEVTATQLVPEKYRGKPADAMVAMMYGKETANLGPLASLQYVAVINGRPAFYGDALPGIAFNKGLVVDMEETLEGEPLSAGWTAVCVVTRASGTKVTQRFSVADAKRAGLWDKAGPWKQYPQRMMQWRARSWAIRDAAPHMLFGPTYEELRDIENYVGPDNARDVSPPSKKPTAAERRAAMAAVESVEIIDENGELHFIPRGAAEQFMRDNPGARRAGEEPHQPTESVAILPGERMAMAMEDSQSPAGAHAAPHNGNGPRKIRIWLGPLAQIEAPAAEALGELRAAIESTDSGAELNALIENNEPLLRALKGSNRDKMTAAIDEARKRLDEGPDDTWMLGDEPASV